MPKIRVIQQFKCNLQVFKNVRLFWDTLYFSANSKQNAMNVSELEDKIEREKESSLRVFEEMKDHDTKLDKELITQKVR